jgi:hypothetical protein
MTQIDMILTHLKYQGPITPLQAWQTYKVLRLAARINDLRAQGWQIETERVQKNGKSTVFAGGIMTDEIIKQMAEIEGGVDVAGNWCPPDGGYEKYNPLDLSELGRLAEKFELDISQALDGWIVFCLSRHATDPDLMTAACKAIIASHGEKRDE